MKPTSLIYAMAMSMAGSTREREIIISQSKGRSKKTKRINKIAKMSRRKNRGQN